MWKWCVNHTGFYFYPQKYAHEELIACLIYLPVSETLILEQKVGLVPLGEGTMKSKNGNFFGSIYK